MYPDFFRELKQHLDADTMKNMRLVSSDIRDLYSQDDLKEKIKDEMTQDKLLILNSIEAFAELAAQDVFLMGSPKITFFHGSYRRHTNFGVG